MKISQEAYDIVAADIRGVIAKMEETGVFHVGNKLVDPDNLNTRMLWDLHHIALMDRGNVDHPRHHHPDMLPRALEFADRSPYWLYDRDGENLNDSHIETALKSIGREIAAERLQSPSMGR